MGNSQEETLAAQRRHRCPGNKEEGHLPEPCQADTGPESCEEQEGAPGVWGGARGRRAAKLRGKEPQQVGGAGRCGAGVGEVARGKRAQVIKATYSLPIS